MYLTHILIYEYVRQLERSVQISVISSKFTKILISLCETIGCNHVSAGILAREMGVQLEFVCAVTQNDVVARTIQTGNYAIADHVIETLAPAMDIQVYNPSLSGLSSRVLLVRKAREIIATVEFYLKDNMVTEYV